MAVGTRATRPGTASKKAGGDGRTARRSGTPGRGTGTGRATGTTGGTGTGRAAGATRGRPSTRRSATTRGGGPARGRGVVEISAATLGSGAAGATRPPPGPTPRERAERGRQARSRASRSSHGDYQPRANRPDPVDLIEAQSRERVPDLVPIRYQRMIESPFRFYRGAAAIMASDLAGTPRSGINVQLCGDAHMLNFRLLGSPERHLMFDINDFDETLPGPWEWDLKRLAASLVIAARGNGFSRPIRREIVERTVHSYQEWMARYAAMTELDVWYAHADVDQLLVEYGGTMLDRTGQRKVSKTIRQARGRDNLQASAKLTEVVDGEPRFRSDPPLIVRISDLLASSESDALMRLLSSVVDSYSETLETDRQVLLKRYRLVDVARKVVGVGSVGTRCWVGLLIGRDQDDPLIIQFKEAGPSVLEDHLPPSEYRNSGLRVVAGQRLMQAASDIFLGWQRVTGLDAQPRDFYVRQLRDWKAVVVAEEMRPIGMGAFGTLCGATLARAHARSGDRIAIAAYLGKGHGFARAMTRFAEAYADQNEADHAALVEAVRSGRVEAATDPSTG